VIQTTNAIEAKIPVPGDVSEELLAE